MKSMIMLTLLILSITVHASSLPFAEMETTEKSLSSRSTINPNIFNIKPTLPSANGNSTIHNQHPTKPDNDENLLRITLDMNDDDKEVVDQDMGKYRKAPEFHFLALSLFLIPLQLRIATLTSPWVPPFFLHVQFCLSPICRLS